jgi:hypothetical protein
MSEPAKHLLMSLIACIFFGYSALNALVFHRRTQARAEAYKNQPLEGMVRSPQYNQVLWFSGVVGVIGFTVSSWQLVISLMALLNAGS